MDDGEVDLSSYILLPNSDYPMDFDDELLRKNSTCTHTHTCNPPGPNAVAHTHTCFHTHTQVLSVGESEEGGEELSKKSRKPLRNREAVRKYRQKKKAHTAYLEEEVKKLRLINQQLLRRLQGQAELEAEVVRLRALLLELRGKIDTELGLFPFQKQGSGTGLSCVADVPCIGGNAGIAGWEGNCKPRVDDCRIDSNGNMDQRVEIRSTNSADLVGSFVPSAS